MNTNKLIVDLLEDDDFLSLTKGSSYYCPFEAMKVDRHEIRHSNYLANILNPYAAHGFGSRVLQDFLDFLASITKDYDSALSVKTYDFNDVEIRREWENIDLIILLKKIDLIFVIEIKVEASESRGQLKKYMETVCTEFPNLKKHYFYLTPSGSEASIKDWLSISFESMVSVLETTHDKLENSLATQIFSSYLNLLKRNHIVDINMLETISRIWNKHHAALSYLYDNAPDGVIDTSIGLFIDSDLINKINDSIPSKAISFIIDHKTTLCVRVAVPEWDCITDFKSANWTRSGRIFLCEIYLKNDFLVIRWVIGRLAESFSTSTIRKDLFDALKPTGQLSPVWKTVSAKKLNISQYNNLNDTSDNKKELIKIKSFIEKTLIESALSFDTKLKSLPINN